jgi:methylglutaconyl-CoA hydratase
MSYETIQLSTDPRGVATLTLDRPDKHNALSSTMMVEIRRAMAALDADPAVRAVVLAANGRSFCAGADLGWMQDNFAQTREQRIAESEVLGAMLQEMDTLGKPLIARVHGQAYAGGIGLISVCDIAIGVPGAMFSVTETRLGLTPANISAYLIGRIGTRSARRLFLNAHFFDGQEALQYGLLDKVVSEDELDAAVESEVTELLQCAPGAVAMTKELIAYVREHDAESIRRHTSTLLADCWEGEEAQTGIAGFFERTPPPWKV